MLEIRNKVRNKTIKFLVNDEEKEYIKNLAEAEGLTVANFLRLCIQDRVNKTKE